MKSFLYLLLLLLLSGCNAKNAPITQLGEARFRISYNNNRELTDAELDSLLNSKPTYGEPAENELYTVLVQKGIVSDNHLDTSTLALKPLGAETPHVHFPELDINLEADIKAGREYLTIKRGKETFKVDLGESLLGDRWVCLFDSNDDGKFELLLLEKYYIMGGDNFDLKVYSL